MKKLLAFALMAFMAAPAFATIDLVNSGDTKVDMYGKIKMSAFYGDVESNDENLYSDLEYDMQGNSRIGFDVTSGQFFAKAELCFRGDGVNGLGFRQLYAGWNFQNGVRLLAGNTDTLVSSTDYFSDVTFWDNAMQGFGGIGDVRRPMIMASYMNFDLALVSNTRDHLAGDAGLADGNLTYPFEPGEEYMPRFEAAYNLKFNNLEGRISASYGLFTEKGTVGAVKDKYFNLDAYSVAVEVKPTFDKFYVGFGAFYSVNTGLYGATSLYKAGPVNTGIEDAMPALLTNGTVQDVTQYGAAIELGYQAEDNLLLAIGGGYQLSSSDQYVDKNNDNKDLNSMGGYILADIGINKYLSITPEIAYFASDVNDAGYKGTDTKEYQDWTILAGAQLSLKF